MKSKKQSIKLFIIPLLVILAVIIVALTVGFTLALYIRGTDDVPNDFKSTGSINPTVINGAMTDDGGLNVGETGYPVYVRVEVIITWKKDGEVLYLKPIAGTDYEFAYNSDDWYAVELRDKKDKVITTYYYFIGSDSNNEEDPTYLNGVVKSGGTTTTLITSFALTEDSKPPIEGYELNVEIIVQTVQAVGKTDEDENGENEIPAWWDAWGLGKDPLNPDSYSGTESGSEGDSDNG